MKKLISVFTAICACLSACVILSACTTQGHTHSYADDWSSDASYHWHACEGEDCTDVADKAEHTWDGGIIISDPTAEKAGEKKFTCQICGATKSEPIPFVSVTTTVTEEEWDATVTKTGNFVYLTDVYFEEEGELAFMGTQEVIFYNDVISLDEEEFYTKEDNVYYLYTLTTYTDDDETFYDLWEKSETNSFLFNAMAVPFSALEGQYANFTFNATDGFYYADDLTVSGSSANIKIKFDQNGEIAECVSDQTIYDMRMVAISTIEYKDVELTLPSLEKMPHTCSFDYWDEYDADYHVGVCDKCYNVLEDTKAAHVWDDGEETEYGLVYTCTECYATQFDSSALEGVWDYALTVENFDNITFSMYGCFLPDYQDFEFTFKLDGDVGADDNGIVTDAEYIANVRNVYINTVLGILSNFDKFVYDSKDEVFTCAGPISYELTINVGKIYSANITITDVIVSIDENNNLAYMSCEMKQEIVNESTGEESELNLTVVFEFSDYGTTVVE